MKKIIINKVSSVLALSLTLSLCFTSCTDKYDEYNVNPHEATNEMMTWDNLLAGAALAQMERNVFIVGQDMGGEYQITEMLEGDIFASYIAPITTWAYTGGGNNDHYRLYNGWYNAPWNDAYTDIMTPWNIIKTGYEEVGEGNSPALAIATVVKVLGMSRITDMYGPIVYSKFGTGLQVAFDSQEEVYKQFFEELDKSIEILNVSDGNILDEYDYVYQGDIKQWTKFANTLRLRLAMRVSNVDEALGRQQAEAAINNPGGLIENVSDNSYLHQGTSLVFKNPLWEVSESFNDMRMSATMECYLKGYEDPRMQAFFRPASASGEYYGVRNGINNINKSSYETKTSGINYDENSDMKWLESSETCFLLAEAALRWGLGNKSAQEYYEEGIRQSFAAAGVAGADDYIANAEKLPLTTWTDMSSNRPRATNVTTSQVTIAWDDNASLEQKMERIMTQKWIALFPDGQEAWSELRRTGYPTIVTIQSNLSNGEVANGEVISRLRFPTTEYADNSANTKAAVGMLKGRDIAGTRLWWDVKR